MLAAALLSPASGRAVEKEALESEAPPLLRDPSEDDGFGFLDVLGEEASQDDYKLDLPEVDVKRRRLAVEVMVSNEDVTLLSIALNDPDVDIRKTALLALGKIGEGTGAEGIGAEAILKMQDRLTDPDMSVRKMASQELTKLGEAAWPGGREKLRQAVHHPDVKFRLAALTCFGLLGENVELDDVAALREALRDSDSVVRWNAAETLGRLGVHAWGSVSGMLTASVSTDVHTRRAAVVALSCLKKEAGPREVGAIHTALMDDDSEVRLAAARGLNSVGPLPEDARDLLREVMLNDHDFNVRRGATMTVGTFGRLAGPAEVLALEEALQDESEDVREAAASSLKSIGVRPWPGGLDGLREAMSSDLVFRRRAAILALSADGAHLNSDEVLFALNDALSQDDPYVLWVASQMLRIPANKIWAGGVAAMRHAAKTGDSYVRRAAISSFGSFGKDILPDDLDFVISSLQSDQDFAVRWIAAVTLGEVFEADLSKVVSALADTFEDQSWLVREAAGKALREIGKRQNRQVAVEVDAVP